MDPRNELEEFEVANFVALEEQREKTQKQEDVQDEHKTTCIVGATNSAHTAAGLAASLPDWRCSMYAPRKTWAEDIQRGLDAGGIELIYGHDDGNKVVIGTPELVTKDPKSAVSDASFVIMGLPATAYEENIRALAPHIKDGAWIGTLCTSGSYDWCIDEAMRSVGRSPDSYKIFALQNLPWACRTKAPGLQVDVCGAKPSMEITARPCEETEYISNAVGRLLHIPCPPGRGGFLGFGLSNICQVIHLAVWRGHLKGWDGVTPFPHVPLFYMDLCQEAADDMDAISQEILALKAVLEKQYQGLDLSVVRHVDEAMIAGYGHYIRDKSSTYKIFTTNAAYATIKCGMKAVEGGFVPDLDSRYFTEDLPYNLVATKGIAELAGVKTPVIDMTIEWAQKLIGKSYLEDGSVANGKDVASSFAPQRFGFNKLSDIPELHFHASRAAANQLRVAQGQGQGSHTSKEDVSAVSSRQHLT